MKIQILFLAFAVCASSARATTFPDHFNFLTQTEEGEISEGDFHQIMDRVTELYSPFAAIHGGTLLQEADWKNDTPQATAKRHGNKWTVVAYGGVARLPSMTPDAFALVMCHEVGHLFGGYVFYPRSDFSTEGEADYFATRVCLRKLWASEAAENSRAREAVSETARSACDQVWRSEKDQNVCYRIAEAAHAMMAALSAGNPPRFESPDPQIAPATINWGYPSPQCRLDTYLRGAICRADFRDDVIPGRTEQAAGASTEALQTAAFRQSCSHDSFPEGARPPCWFKDLR